VRRFEASKHLVPTTNYFGRAIEMKLRLASVALCLGAVVLGANGSAFAAGGSGGGGGGATNCDTTPVLPTAAPAAGIIMRESFGAGPNVVRPTGGKGCNKPSHSHTALTGFWVEYPGSKNATWLTAPESVRTWRFCGGGDPNELPTPLQPTIANGDNTVLSILNGCAVSDWTDPQLPFDQAP